ncbi:MAG: serine hydrolase [Bacteroidota bacterium]
MPLRLAFAALLALTACSPGDDASSDGLAALSEAGVDWDAYDPLAASAAATDTSGLDPALADSALAQFDRLPRLRALVVARHGEVLLERYRDGYGLDEPANVKSASKSVLSAVAGAALASGVFEGVDAPVAPLFERELAAARDTLDPRVRQITWEDLLTMRAGLASTSGRNYSRWVLADDWVEAALARPVVAAPGTRRIYSTGTSHLLGVALARAADESLLALTRRTLGEPLGLRVPAWPTDPQGRYFGGNDMQLSPRFLLRLGEAYRQGGEIEVDGERRRIVPEAWVWASWRPVTEVGRGRGYGYGYAWFTKTVRSGDDTLPVFFAWGFGGQYLFVVPDLALTVVALSTTTVPTGEGGHGPAVHALLDEALIPAARRGLS